MAAGKQAQQQGLVDREFHSIRELLEMLMSESSPTRKRMPVKPSFGWAPPTDVYETEDAFVVTMDIAGLERDHILVETTENVLIIRGVRDETAPRGRKQFHKLEIQVGPFQRLIQVPPTVDIETMSKTYDKGFLEIRLKKRSDINRREIDIE